MSAISLVDSYLVKVKGGGLPNISLSSWCRLSLDVVNDARLSSWMANPLGTALDADAACLPDTPNRGTPNPLYSVVLHTRGPPRADPASFSNLVETMVGCPPAFEIVGVDLDPGGAFEIGLQGPGGYPIPRVCVLGSRRPHP